MKRLVLFVACFVVWLLLAWPYDPATGVRWQEVGLGAIASLVVALVMRELTRDRFHRWLNPVRWFWAVVYLFVFAAYVASIPGLSGRAQLVYALPALATFRRRVRASIPSHRNISVLDPSRALMM